MLHGTFVDGSALHANQEVILVINEEYEDVLAQSVFLRCHIVLRMRQYAGLEDGSKIVRCHLVDI